MAAVVFALTAGGVAYATIPDSGGVIHGCYTKSGGSLRVIDAGVTNCKSGETSLDWNQRGAQGVPGPQGPQGPQGLAGSQGSRGPTGPAGTKGDQGLAGSRGPTGASGLAGLHILTGDNTIEPGVSFAGGKFCPSGEVATGGGYEFHSQQDADNVRIVWSLPLGAIGGKPDGWGVASHNEGTSPITVTTWVICSPD